MKNCQCMIEPRGDHGLEGFQRDCIYFFEIKEKYVRVYLTPDYYETCSTRTFIYYFKEIL